MQLIIPQNHFSKKIIKPTSNNVAVKNNLFIISFTLFIIPVKLNFWESVPN